MAEFNSYFHITTIRATVDQLSPIFSAFILGQQHYNMNIMMMWLIYNIAKLACGPRRLSASF